MKEKFVLITGGAKRIGATTSRYLHKKGFNIILHYNNSELEAKKVKVIKHVLDSSDSTIFCSSDYEKLCVYQFDINYQNY